MDMLPEPSSDYQKNKFRIHLEVRAKKAPSAPVSSLSQSCQNIRTIVESYQGQEATATSLCCQENKITDEIAQMPSNASIPILVSAHDNNAIIGK